MSESLSGSVERVTFFNEENGFAILRVKVKGRFEAVTCLCSLPSVHAGEWVEAEGAWVRDPNHGLQFKAASAKASAPTTEEGIERYLGSGLIKGVREGFAKKLVAKFGVKIFDVIENESARLEEIPGVGLERRKAIKNAWAEQRHVREIMLFLYAHGAGTARAQRIFKTYGEKSIEVVRDDPYQLARDIHGIGFRTADEIAGSLGIAPDSTKRALAGLRHVLQEAAGAEGHCALPRAELLARAEKLLGVTETVTATALENGLKRADFITEQIEDAALIYLPPLLAAEIDVARRVRALADAPSNYPTIDFAKATAWAEKQSDRELSVSQRTALRTMLSSRIAVLTGGPGVGKTTLLDAFLRIVLARQIVPVLCAPTGRAAQRLTAATGQPAKTIHRLLEARGGGGFQRGPGRPLEGDLFVVDESSMLDLLLFDALLRALPPNASLLLVGDVDQLPSVGPGLVLRQLIESEIVPTARLAEIFRQAAASRIVVNAHRINAGEMPERTSGKDANADFFVISRAEAADVAETILELVVRRIPARFGLDPRCDIQVLSPMNRGACGTRELNRRLQAALNPARDDGGMSEVERFGWTFRVGDRVIQTENNYDKEVFNGDIGRLSHLDAAEREIAVEFDGRKSAVRYDFGELDQLAPAYAITVHKSQGSEFPAVVIPIVSDQFLLLQRNLLYTAITRGRQLVIVAAQTRALQRAVRETGSHRRVSGLLARLRGVVRRGSRAESQQNETS